MNLKSSFISAIKAIKRNKMRSALTSIGIIIGVASVIVMIGLGSSAKVEVRQRVTTFGTNAMSVYRSKVPLRQRDIDYLSRNYPQIRYITPIIYQSDVITKYISKNIHSRIYGVNLDFFKIQKWDLADGRFFTNDELVSNDKVVVIGYTVKRELFLYENPINKEILVLGKPYKVIGVLSEAGSSFSGRDFDNLLVFPYTTVSTRITGDDLFDEIRISAQSELMLEDTTEAVIEYFRTSHKLGNNEKNDFRLETSKEKLKVADYISQTLTYLLAGIASISLFVGGVGIMNIMLVSVSERTREIGIRMAIGAKEKDILMQFLIEAMTLSGVGGLIGIITGLGIYIAIISFVDWGFIFSIVSIVISFGFSCAVGVFFGYYPAKKAASLKPIDALRFE